MTALGVLPQTLQTLQAIKMLGRKIGRDDWIRTSDPLTPSQVRYQAAPHPEMSLRS